MSDLQRRVLNRAAAPITLQKRADGGLDTIVGYAAVFYKEGDPGTEYRLWSKCVERIMPGAFDKALAAGTGDDVRALFNHDAGLILGRTGAGTCRLSVDSRGLRYEIDPPDTTVARDLIASIRRGDVSGSSFSFIPRATTDRDTADGGYVLERIDCQLFDVGPVTFPAYAGTEAGMRAAGDVGKLREEVEGRRRDRDRDSVAVALALADTELAD